MKQYFSNPFREISQTVNAKTQITNLQKWHRVLAVIYAAQGLLVLLLSAHHDAPVKASYLVRDSLSSSVAGQTVWASAVHVIFNANLTYLLAAALFVATIINAIMSVKQLRYKDKYEASVKKGAVPLRWLNFAVSGGLLLVLVALISGVYDISTLGLMLTLLAASAVFGLLTERGGGRLSFVAAMATATLTGLVPICYLMHGAIYGDGRLTGYVYGVVVVMLAYLVATMLTVYFHRQKIGRWSDVFFTEKTFLVRQLVVWTVLTWTLFVGLLSA